MEVRTNPRRILIGTVEVAGYASRLCAGFESLGIPAVQLDLSGHPFKYPRSNSNPRVARMAEGASRARRSASDSSAPTRWALLGVELFARALLLAWALVRFDAFLLVYGSGFFRQFELPLLRLFRKRIVLIFCGSDTRPPYMDGYDLEAPVDGAGLANLARRKKRVARRAERFADAVVCNPSSGQFFENPLLGFVDIGIPIPLGPAVLAQRRDGSRVRLLHAPSHPKAKGTGLIRAAAESLIRQGVDLELVEIIGQPNDMVMKELARCDLVVDQLFADTPLAGLATEAAALGRPSILGSYDWPEVIRHISPEALPPSHRCHPDDVEQAIRLLVEDRRYRERLGSAAAAYVHSRWTPEQVAGRYLRILNGEPQASWWHDPGSVQYIAGCGVEMATLRAATASIVDKVGREGLQLMDKPDLEGHLLAMLD